MTNTALEVLRAIENACGAHGPDDIPYELLAEFESQLAKFEPFRFVHQGWLRLQGGWMSGQLLSSHWVWRQFKRGLNPDEVLNAAEAQVAQNSYEVLEVYPIYGLKVTHRFEFSPDTYICRSDELPKSNQYDMAFFSATYPSLPPLRHDASALVFKIKIDPAIVSTKPKREQDAQASERGKLSFLVQHTLPLLTDSPIEMPNKYTEMASDSLVCGTGGHFIGGGQPVGAEASLVRDLCELPALAKSIEAMASSAILLSIDRLMASRLRVRLEDRLLDLGIAAEIALMHEPSGGGDGKGEITAKISSRGAWLLGRDGAERLAISKDLKALYSARSKVVHTGRSHDKLKLTLPSFDRLVVRILRELLHRGKFPDWNRLTLGVL